jgi:SPX domain protein involved in polyphosphate accumulation
VGVSMVKDAYEDYQRAKQDKTENNRKVKFAERGQSNFVESLAKKI